MLRSKQWSESKCQGELHNPPFTDYQQEKTVSYFYYRKGKRIYNIIIRHNPLPKKYSDKNFFSSNRYYGELTSHSLPVNPHWQTQAICVWPSTHFPAFIHEEGWHSTTKSRLPWFTALQIGVSWCDKIFSDLILHFHLINSLFVQQRIEISADEIDQTHTGLSLCFSHEIPN